MLKAITKKHIPLLFILALGCVLRFYKLFELEYTYDELSALNRTTYQTLSELIDKGVTKLDTHPALIQIFLYFFTKLFGTAEWMVKLPFILAGIASIYIVYRIGRKWFSETAALLTAFILAATQFFIFYSVTARPYISGLLLCLLTLHYWLNILFDAKATKKDYLLFAVFASLSALNHHFSMMFAGLCGLIGLFFLAKSTAKYYLGACLGALVLYSPHFPILLYQLGKGGIGTAEGGWLDVPRNDFIIQFLLYIFHYSYVFVAVFIGAIVISSAFKSKARTSVLFKIRLVLFSLFALSFLAGFFYSQKISPVIQFSTLIFSAPCLILFVSSFSGETTLKFKLIGLGVLTVVSLSSLIFKRQYYKLIFQQPFDTYIRTADEIQREKGNEGVFCIFKSRPWFLNFYKEKYASHTSFLAVDHESLKLEDYQSMYDTLSTNYLVVGDLNPSQLLQASSYYPYIYQKKHGYNFEIYTLSKKAANSSLEAEKHYIASTNFSTVPERFVMNTNFIHSEAGKHFYQVDSLNEYPISYKIKNADIGAREGQTVMAQIQIKADKPIKGLFCGSTDASGKNVHWAANEMEAYYNHQTKLQTAYVAVYVNPYFNNADNELSLFVWNSQKEQFKITSFSVFIWDNNPYRLGLLSDF
jgi:hypothetical protein